MRDELLKIWPRGIKTLLDLGCRDCWHTSDLPGVTKHVGVEVWQPALERAFAKVAAGGLPNFEGKNAEVVRYLSVRDDDEFDAVVAIDLLEHIEKDKALTMLDDMVRVSAKIAVVWTTLGFIEQGPHDVDGQPNPFEEHLWGPLPLDFAERQWQVQTYPDWHGSRGGAILAWKMKE